MRRFARSLTLLVALATAAHAGPMKNADWNDLKKEAQKAAAQGQNGVLVDKLRELAADDSERALDFIAELAVRVPDITVYEAARDAIAGMQSDAALTALVEKAGKDRNPMVKILLVDAIAQRSDDASAAGIANALGDRTDEVVRAAVAAAKKRKAPQAVDALIDVFDRLSGGREADGLLMVQVKEALLAITDQEFRTAEDWRKYWSVAKASFRPRVTTGDKPKELSGGTETRKRPTFFGSEIRSNRLAFVIDTSGSMEAADPLPPNGDPAGGSRVRMERAKTQLLAVIDALPADVRFTIISYSGAMFAGPNPLPPGTPEDGPLPPTLGGFEWLKVFKPKILPANDKTKAEAKEWVKALQANGATFTYNALRAAFEVEGIDTIVLLSDGVPTEINRKTKGEMSTTEILEEVRELNRFRRLRIDCFGFDAGGDAPPAGAGGGSRGRPPMGPGGALGQFLLDLAAQNGGKYTQIQ
jgi:hypothetical protein